MRAALLPALFAVAAAAPALLAPEQLRVDGSDFSAGRDASVAYAVAHDRKLQFTWAPRHEQDGAIHRAFSLTVEDAVTGEVFWASGLRSSTAALTHYEGHPLPPGRLYRWRVAWSDDGSALSPPAESHFRTALADADWAGIPWVGSDATNVYRATFPADSAATHYTLYICGLGYSDTNVNGQAAAPGTVLLSAPWTANWKMNMYSTYDITPSVHDGTNVITVALGNGWRDLGAFSVKDNAGQGYDPKADTVQKVFRAIVEVTRSDGSTTRVLTSGDVWDAARGPVTADSVFDGETYDARVASGLRGMHAAEYVAERPLWRTADTAVGPPGAMEPWAAPAVMVSREYPAVQVTYPAAGVAVVDFGSNVAGVVRLRNIDIPAGRNVTIRHAEVLNHAGNPDMKNYVEGSVYTGNLRSARATDVYISNGTPEDYQPKFTYHGFRYAEVTGYGRGLSVDDIVLVHFHSAIAQRTTTEFGTPLLNAMQRMALGAQRSNAMSLMTDCPQRDERLGWNGDSALSSDSYALNYDVASFFRHVIKIQASALDPHDKSLPDVAPHVRYGGRPADVSWSISLPQLISVLHNTFTDIETVRTYLPVVADHLTNVQAQAARGLAKMNTPYGDWCPPPPAEHPSSAYTSAFSYLQMTRLAKELSAAAGNATATKAYDDMLNDLKQKFHDAFYNDAAGTFDTDVMVAYSLAAALENPADIDAARAGLMKSVAKHDNHFSCGIIGFKYLFDALDAAGQHATSLAILEQTDYPSIGYFLTNAHEPATENLWEILDAPREGPGMNSRNHHMFSSYSAYLVRKLAGVDLAAGVLAPPPLDLDVPWARTTSRTPNGDVSFAWSRVGGVQCAKGFLGEARSAHANRLELSCGTGGGVIEEVLFASFGDARGAACGGYTQHPTCHHPASADVVTKRCLNRGSCVVDLGQFDVLPCASHMRATVRCSAAGTTRVEASVPVGSVLHLRIPQGAAVRDATTNALVGGAGERVPLKSGLSVFTMEPQGL